MSESIQLGGQDRPFHVGTNQGDIFCKLQGLTLQEYAAVFNDVAALGFGVQRDFLFSALKAGYEKLGLRLDFTHLTVGDWMDAPEYDAGATFGVVLGALGDQFNARAAFQQERAKNAPAPKAGAKLKALPQTEA